MDLLLSLFPIILLIYLMTRKKAVPSYRALPLVAAILYMLSVSDVVALKSVIDVLALNR
ncbi:hypothetical protein [Geoalkalibacter subterraneus]|jgi:lactate permease|uniref:hypothetical protein n=1 Tax=Geoalkalibacter subterraneus TaxID=483547 RepID=UPI00130E1875|nr:hypothetical protein [Geoalkalibacter subterraneus]